MKRASTSSSTSRTASRTMARVFVAGAAAGFLAGAFVACAIVWQYGDVVGSRAANRAHPPAAPDAVQRFADGKDYGGDGVADGDAAVRGTASEPSPVVPPSMPREPAIGPVAADELENRDLLIPVQGIQPEHLTQTFSERRGGDRTHEAIDILAPMNTPVLAVEGGTVARLFYSKAGGITVYQFDPTERFCYYYAHLDRYAEGLKEGLTLKKGQVIGYVGVSGNAPKATPHLHFAIFKLTDAKRWWEGSPVDPYDVLR